MNYLLVENVSKAFGEKVLFENITFGIDAGQKTALIARNGIGKSSLLNIIVGTDSPDSGNVVFRKGIRVSFLSQNPVFDDDKTVLDVLFAADNVITAAVKEYENALFISGNNEEGSEEALHVAMSEMDAAGAWDYESKVKEVLTRFSITDFSQRIGELSGGQRKKVALAKVLIDDADLLIMDEPTNHLDITMIEWMEDYLSRQRLSLLVVTHDRYFLDNVCNEVIELEGGNLYKYKGNYAYYLEKRAERVYNDNIEIEKARNLYRRELEWMRRQPQARGTKAKARIESFYDLEETASKRTAGQKQELKVNMGRLGNKILELRYVCKAFENNRLIEDFVYTFKKGEKIGIVGGNGSGKSTFLNMITGAIKPDKGTIVVGDTIKFGYYTQEGLQVDPQMRVIDIVKSVAEELPVGKGTLSASQFLYHFGYSREVQWNSFGRLSGGERRKLYLLMVLMQNPNFLILDEPTNDLDIYTLNILEDFLLNYDGCLMVVSHDRYFMDKIADHLFAFEGNGVIKDFPGNYTDYLLWRQQKDKQLKATVKPEPQVNNKPEKIKNSNRPTYKQTMEYESLSSEIESLEFERDEITGKINAGEGSTDDFKVWSLRLNQISELLEVKEMRWLELSELF